MCVCNFPTENEVIESHLYYIFILGKGVTCVDLHLCLHPVLCIYVVSQLAPGLHRDSSPTSPPYRLHCSPHRARWWAGCQPGGMAQAVLDKHFAGHGCTEAVFQPSLAEEAPRDTAGHLPASRHTPPCPPCTAAAPLLMVARTSPPPTS